MSPTAIAACGHLQAPPTAEEIASCPDIIVRVCQWCKTELWWSGPEDRWRRL